MQPIDEKQVLIEFIVSPLSTILCCCCCCCFIFLFLLIVHMGGWIYARSMGQRLLSQAALLFCWVDRGPSTPHFCSILPYVSMLLGQNGAKMWISQISDYRPDNLLNILVEERSSYVVISSNVTAMLV